LIVIYFGEIVYNYVKMFTRKEESSVRVLIQKVIDFHVNTKLSNVRLYKLSNDSLFHLILKIKLGSLSLHNKIREKCCVATSIPRKLVASLNDRRKMLRNNTKCDGMKQVFKSACLGLCEMLYITIEKV
jgi:hypothetical protein